MIEPVQSIAKVMEDQVSSNIISLPIATSQNEGSPEQSKGAGKSSHVPCGAPKEEIGVRRTKDQSLVNQGSYVHITPVNDATRKYYPREYKCWDNMKQRCRTLGYVLDPRFEKFSDFLFHMGELPGSTWTLDRIDPDNPVYAPGYCRWAPKKLQTSNRRNTRYLTDNSGTRLSAAEWSRRMGISTKTMLGRIDRGWSEHDAIHTPLNQRRKSKEAKFSNPETSARTKEAIALWRRIVRVEHDHAFYSAIDKDAGMLKQFLSRVEAVLPGSSIDLLEMVLVNWAEFCVYAEFTYSAFNSPLVPTIEYLTRYCNAAGNWYLEQLQEEEHCRDLEVRQT